MSSTRAQAFVSTPLGRLYVTVEGELLTGLFLPDHKRGPATPAALRPADRDARFAAIARQLEEYFAGRRRRFDVPLKMAGTPFQRDVWRALAEIPFGTTVSYAELAARVGRPAAARAVGLANSRNPISIIVPCHRVIGANGSLTGYAGGLDTKRWLLDFERTVSRQLVATASADSAFPA